MNPGVKIKALEEITRAEEEASKYHLEGDKYHVFWEVLDEPGMFWMPTANGGDGSFDRIKVSREEVHKYARFSKVVIIRYKEIPIG